MPATELHRRSGPRLLLWSLPLAFLPLFVGLPSFSVPIVHLLDLPTTRESLNISGSIVVCMLGFAAWFGLGVSGLILRHITFCILWLTASLIVGLFYEPGMINVLFYVQTVLPLFALAYGWSLIKTPDDVRSVIRVASAATSFFVVFLVVATVWNYGLVRLTLDRLSVMKELAYAIPQFKSYYPLTVLATFSFALAHYLFHPRTDRSTTALLAAHGLFLPLCWSRAGMLGFVLCSAVQFGCAMVVGSAISRRRVLTVALLFMVVLPVAASKMGSTFSAREDVHSLDNKSDRKRLELFLEGCGRIAASPLFGDMFIPTWEERAGGESVDMKRLFGSHNQFVDLGIRAGFVYLAAALWLMLDSLRRARRLVLSKGSGDGPEYRVVGVAGVSFLIAALAGSNFQLYLIQLQTAAPIYAMVGIVHRTHALAFASAGASRAIQTVPRRAVHRAPRLGPLRPVGGES